MWIKASGTQLAEALTRDIFVPCDVDAMRASVTQGEARADRPAEFALVTGGLRPSIETSLHAVFPQRIVVHVHCVNTIALAIRADAKAALAGRLAGFDWAFVPYAKPGADLARAVAKAKRPATDVLVLGNHGLIVAAETVAAADALLGRVAAAVQARPAAALPDMAALAARGGDGFAPLPMGHPLHAVALSPRRLAAALSGSLYPDHVIFCGVGATALAPDEGPGQAVMRVTAKGLPPPPFLLVPGAGALMAEAVSSGAVALTRCLGDVLSRWDEGAEVTVLTPAQNAELLDWDAEKYRRALDAR